MVPGSWGWLRSSTIEVRTALSLRRVGDRGGAGRHVGPDAVLEVEGEGGLGEEVGVPAGRSVPGATAQVGPTACPEEEDLDASGPAAAAPGSRDGDDALPGAGRRRDLDLHQSP